MLTRSPPFLPIISPRLMYLLRLLFTLPRTSLRKRWWSRSIFWPMVGSADQFSVHVGQVNPTKRESRHGPVPTRHPTSRKQNGRRNHRHARRLVIRLLPRPDT